MIHRNFSRTLNANMENNDIPMVPVVLAIFAVVAFVLFLGLIILFAFLISRAAKRRSYDTGRGQQVQEAARQIGFTFQDRAELSALPFLAGFELFEGNPLKIENLLTGKIEGRDSVIFDLVYRNVGAGGGSGTTTSRQTMAAIISNELNLPTFYLRPEGAIEKVLNAVSRIDIDFAERPNFSRAFLLYGKDEGSIRQLFTIPKLDFFEKNTGLSVFGSRDCLVLYNSRSVAPPGQIGQYMTFLNYLRNLFRQ